MSQRPLLFVDIDGVLNPYGGALREGFDEHRPFGHDEIVRISARHERFLDRPAGRYELVWVTAWSVDARRWLASVLRLPPFAGAVSLPEGEFDPDEKIVAVDRHAGERPAAWIDDQLTERARDWARRRRAPTLLVAVDPGEGLSRRHVDELEVWAKTIGSAS